MLRQVLSYLRAAYWKRRLLAALRMGNAERISHALDQGIDPNFEDASGRTPLQIAVENKNRLAFGLLIRRGAHFPPKRAPRELFLQMCRWPKEGPELIVSAFAFHTSTADEVTMAADVLLAHELYEHVARFLHAAVLTDSGLRPRDLRGLEDLFARARSTARSRDSWLSWPIWA